MLEARRFPSRLNAASAEPLKPTRAHTYTTHAETSTAREQLHGALTATVSKSYGIWLVGAGNAATAVLARRDYYAGQVTAHASRIIAAELQALPGSRQETGQVRLTGALQVTLLSHSLRIHKTRADAIPKAQRIHQYRKAMWARQRADRSANQSERRSRARGNGRREPLPPIPVAPGLPAAMPWNGPGHPANEAGGGAALARVQAQLDTTVPINSILTVWGLLMGRTPGDGDCGYHASLRTAQRTLSRGLT
jgi:hypothetical protein